jgi:hypothetical protein
MSAHLPRQAPYPRSAHPRTVTSRAADRLRRLLAVLAGVTVTMLASVATVPAAFASVEPDPVRIARVVTAGRGPGWQTAVIALGAVL